ncbi:MAG: hypothetical protein M3P50_06910 [Actinomycetota bacterium]|nr:hypothetical protein [Actinomycetota bacterium]
MSGKRMAGLACSAILGVASGIGIAACGEDRGGVEVEGGGTTATSTTPTIPGTTPAP